MNNQPDPRATREHSRVALVTCAELPDLDPDDRLVVAALASLGVRTEAVVWDAPEVEWSGYDLAVVRSPWDYVARHRAFLAWAGRVPRLANPAVTIAWNTDKRYLAELAAAGVAVVPTTWVEPGEAWAAPAGGEYVVKPAVGAGSLDSGRYRLDDPEHRRLAGAHVARLQAAGRRVMVQPYLAAVDSAGETALLYFAGRYSHAIRKGPMLDGPDAGVAGLYKQEEISAREPTAAERELAGAVLAAIPPRAAPGGWERLLYARVDLIPGADGAPLLVELELTEPSLFLGYAAGAAARFAAAIAAQLGPAAAGPADPVDPVVTGYTGTRSEAT